MIIDLNENEVGALVSLMDAALKAHGLQAMEAVGVVMSKLEAAKLTELAEIEMAKLEAAKLADTEE